MPYVSRSQQRKFHVLEAQGKISHETVKEFDEATKHRKGGYKTLPEYRNIKEAGWDDNVLGTGINLKPLTDIYRDTAGRIQPAAQNKIDELSSSALDFYKNKYRASKERAGLSPTDVDTAWTDHFAKIEPSVNTTKKVLGGASHLIAPLLLAGGAAGMAYGAPKILGGIGKALKNPANHPLLATIAPLVIGHLGGKYAPLIKEYMENLAASHAAKKASLEDSYLIGYNLEQRLNDVPRGFMEIEEHPDFKSKSAGVADDLKLIESLALPLVDKTHLMELAQRDRSHFQAILKALPLTVLGSVAASTTANLLTDNFRTLSGRNPNKAIVEFNIKTPRGTPKVEITKDAAFAPLVPEALASAVAESANPLSKAIGSLYNFSKKHTTLTPFLLGTAAGLYGLPISDMVSRDVWNRARVVQNQFQGLVGNNSYGYGNNYSYGNGYGY